MSIISTYIKQVQATLNHMPLAEIGHVIDVLYTAWESRQQVFIMGNGGSASTASHFVCDLSKNTRVNGYNPFRVIGLTDNVALMTAYGNDEGYENIFAQQLLPLVRPSDVVIGISTSGNSPNVVKAIEVANEHGATTIGFTGFNGGKLSKMIDIEVHVASEIIEQVEDIHLMLEHMICMDLKGRIERQHQTESNTEVSATDYAPIVAGD